MASNEERSGIVCVSLRDMSKGEARTPEAGWNAEPTADSRVEMGEHSYGFCSGLTGSVQQNRLYMGACGQTHEIFSFHSS